MADENAEVVHQNAVTLKLPPFGHRNHVHGSNKLKLNLHYVILQLMSQNITHPKKWTVI